MKIEIKKIIFAPFKFFIRNDEVSWRRIAIVVFLIICIKIMLIKINYCKVFSDMFMNSVFTFTLSLLGLDTWRENKKQVKPDANNDSTGK